MEEIQGFCATHPDKGWISMRVLTTGATEDVAWDLLWNAFDSDDYSRHPGWCEGMGDCEDGDRFRLMALQEGWKVVPCRVVLESEL